MDTFTWLALVWLLLYLCIRYAGRMLFGRRIGSAEPSPPSDPDSQSPVLVVRPRIGSAPAAIVTMSRGAVAALVARRTQSRLRVRASSRANGASRRVPRYARRSGSFLQPR